MKVSNNLRGEDFNALQTGCTNSRVSCVMHFKIGCTNLFGIIALLCGDSLQNQVHGFASSFSFILETGECALSFDCIVCGLEASVKAYIYMPNPLHATSLPYITHSYHHHPIETTVNLSRTTRSSCTSYLSHQTPSLNPLYYCCLAETYVVKSSLQVRKMSGNQKITSRQETDSVVVNSQQIQTVILRRILRFWQKKGKLGAPAVRGDVSGKLG